MHKISTHHKHTDGKVFAWMALMMGFATGMLFPIFPNFVKSIVESDQAVSIFYSAMAVIMLVSASLSTIFFKKFSRSTIVKIGLFMIAAAMTSFIFVNRLVELAMFQALKVWFNMFILIALALFVRDFAKKKELGKEEGRYYKFQNIGLLIGPIMGGFLATKFDYEIVFGIAAGTVVFALAFFYHQHVILKHPAIARRKFNISKKLIHNVKEFFKNGPRSKAYIITLAFMSWTSFRRLYIPLFVVLEGYKDSMSGLILGISLLPLILLEEKVGEYGDKHSLRKPISLGFLIIGGLLISVFFSPNVILAFIFLIMINLGGALVEPLQEDFLFRHLPEDKEDELYGVYMTSDPVAFFLTPTIGAVILFFLPFKYLFLIFGIIMLLVSSFVRTNLKRS